MKAQLVSAEEIDTFAWDELVTDSPQGSIFMQSWYINAILGEWQGIVVHDKNNVLQAVMPLCIKSKFIFEYSLQPILAKYWGICFRNEDFKNYYEEYSWKKKITEEIISKIPNKLSKFHHNFHPHFDYPLPFYWKNFSIITKYTYILPLENASEKLELIHKNVLRKVNSQSRDEITISEGQSITPLLQLFAENEKSGKMVFPKIYFPVLEKLHAACAAKGQCFVLNAMNKNNEIIASGLFLKDERSVYFHSGIASPAYRQSAAMAMLVTEAIRTASHHAKQFDFLGSMMEGIESFFRSFGPKPVPYIAIEKNRLPF